MSYLKLSKITDLCIAIVVDMTNLARATVRLGNHLSFEDKGERPSQFDIMRKTGEVHWVIISKLEK